MGKESEIIDIDKEGYGTIKKVGIEKDIDDVFDQAGPLGCYQLLIQISTFYLFLVTIYNFVFSFFTGNDPPWRCVSNNSSYFCKIHYNKNIAIDNDVFTARCHLKRDEWTYVSGKNYSFVTEFDLICGKTSMAALISGSYYLGGVLGAAVTGTLADAYGRVHVLLFTTLLTTCSSIASGYITNIWQLFGLNIFRGAGNVGCYYTTIVYQSEFSSPRYRSMTMNILLFGSTLSFLSVDLFANYVRNWRHLTIYAALPCIPIFIVFFFIPESPRWLLATGRKEPAERIMQKITKSSGKSNSVIHLQSPSYSQEEKYTYLDLVRNIKILKLTSTIVIIWFVIPVVYYSIALQSSSFGGNIYEAFALSTLADIPAYVFSTFLSNKFGRKKTNLGGLFISGLLMGSLVLVPRHLSYKFTINITIAFLARFSNCIAFCGMYTWTFELFPTVLRSQGLSLCAIFDRLGMFVVPFITRVLQNVSYIMPLIIMCLFAVFASIIGLLLPETYNKPTRESYDDFFESETSEID